jgi:3-dehydrosphinganine reductase
MRKVALITGGSSGLGFKLAEQLGKSGYAVVLLARNQARLDTAVAQLRNSGIEAQGFSCDVTDEAGLQQVFAAVQAACGVIDYLILNAGVVTPKLFVDYADAGSLKRELDVDLWGTILPAYQFLPLLHAGAKILLVSSGFGLMGAAGYTMYCAAKAGVVMFGEALRRELLSRNINVYAACPGDMDTPMFHEEIRNSPPWMNKKTPRTIMTPEAVATKILQQAQGRRKFLIIPSADVGMLLLLQRLPKRLLDAILDKMFPVPQQMQAED